MSEWQSWPPPEEYMNGFRGPEFLAIRNGRFIICWWTDERYARRPNPHWDGTDMILPNSHLKKVNPKYWMPIPSVPEKEGQ